jgi:hypothetical protein
MSRTPWGITPFWCIHLAVPLDVVLYMAVLSRPKKENNSRSPYMPRRGCYSGESRDRLAKYCPSKSHQLRYRPQPCPCEGSVPGISRALSDGGIGDNKAPAPGPCGIANGGNPLVGGMRWPREGPVVRGPCPKLSYPSVRRSRVPISNRLEQPSSMCLDMQVSSAVLRWKSRLGHEPPESVFTSKKTTTVVTPMIALLHMHALVMPLKVRLADKPLVAVCNLAGKGVFPLLIVCFHVSLKVIAATKELATTLHFTLEVRFLLGRETPWRATLAGNAECPLLSHAWG